MTILSQNTYSNSLMKGQNHSYSMVSFTRRENILPNSIKPAYNSSLFVKNPILPKDVFELQKSSLTDSDITRKTPFKTTKSQPFDPNKNVPYRNSLAKNLKAKPNPQLKALLLADPAITDENLAKAVQRTKNFSRYLKEDMVGFITPEGKHWFKEACTYLIKGTAGLNITSESYEKFAKQLWSHLAKADKYWVSDDFIKYLQLLDPKTDKGVEATIEAIKEIQPQFMTRSSNISFGYDSDMRFIDKLLKDGCAYTGVTMELDPESPAFPTLEHLFPHCNKGDVLNNDSNYVLTTSESNGLRGNIPLIAFLQGWDANDFTQEFPHWKSETRAALKPPLTPEQIEKRKKAELKKELKQQKHQKRIETLKRRNNTPENIIRKEFNTLKRELKAKTKQMKLLVSKNQQKTPAYKDLTECVEKLKLDIEKIKRNVNGLN